MEKRKMSKNDRFMAKPVPEQNNKKGESKNNVHCSGGERALAKDHFTT